MKKLILLIIVFYSTITLAQNNAESFDFSFNIGGGYNTTKRMAYNSQGDLFCMVNVGNKTIFGSTTLQATGFGSFPGNVTFIGKRSTTGEKTVFASVFSGSPSATTFEDFTIDSNNNVIVVGSVFGFNETIFHDFGNGVSLYGKGNFVAKYNPEGVCQWATLIDYDLATASSSENKPIGIGVLPNNDIYFAGRSTNGAKPFWLVRLNPDGTEIWHKEWILPGSFSVAILASKNNCFFDNNGNATFYVANINGNFITVNDETLTAPGTGHPSTAYILSIDGNGNNGIFTSHRGAISDLSVEKETGNVLLLWSQYSLNPAPFDTVDYNQFNQYGGVVALDSNRNYITSTLAVSFGISLVESILPLGDLKFVGNDRLDPAETITAGSQTYTTTNYAHAWKFFEDFEITKFVAHPEVNGSSTSAYPMMARHNNKLAVSGVFALQTNPTVNVNGTTLTSCEHDLTFGTTYPIFASSTNDVHISQLTIDEDLKTEEFEATKTFAFYPNPTNGILNIESTADMVNASLKIVTITGQVILEKHNLFGRKVNLDVSNLASGLYIIELQDGNSKITSKFVKL